MHSINTVILSGRLGKDLGECLRYTATGRAFLSFNLAVDDGYFSKEQNAWVDRTHWVNITAWGKDAEYYTPKFNKGDMVVVYAKVVTNTREVDGKKWTFPEIVINGYAGGMKALGRNPNAASGPSVHYDEADGSAPDDGTEDDTAPWDE